MIEKSFPNSHRFTKTIEKMNGRRVAVLFLSFASVCIVTVQIIGAFGSTIVNDTNTTIGQFLLFVFKK